MSVSVLPSQAPAGTISPRIVMMLSTKTRGSDVITKGEFHLGYAETARNRLRRSRSDAAFAQALFVISEAAIKDDGNAVSRPLQEPRSASR
jgi:hypothetical protein